MLKPLENDYKVLAYDIKSESYGNGEKSKKAKAYLKFLKNRRFWFYLHFFEEIAKQLKPSYVILQGEQIFCFNETLNKNNLINNENWCDIK